MTVRISRRWYLPLSALALALAAGCGDDGGPTGGDRPQPPVIGRLVAVPVTVARGGTSTLTVLAGDANDDSLRYQWSATAGTFSTTTADRVRWTAPATAGNQTVTVIVSDGALADTAGIELHVGSGSLTVASEPPLADIYLNNNYSGFRTPHVFSNLPIGEQTVQLGGAFFLYQPTDTTVTLSDGDGPTITFTLPPPRSEVVRTGADAMDEIGGLAYTAGGIGLVYTARIGDDVSLRSASLFGPASGGNGRVLMTGLNFDESLTIRPVPFSNQEIGLVRNDDLYVGELVDLDVDGLMERMNGPWRVNGLAGSAYAPAFSRSGHEIAFALQPSSPPNATDFLFAADYESLRVNRVRPVATKRGNSPTWGFDQNVIFENGGELWSVEVDSLQPQVPEPITRTGGFARRPAISPNGKYVAYLDDRGRVELFVPELGVTATIWPEARTRFVAWSPFGHELLIADNAGPGQAVLRLLTELPIP